MRISNIISNVVKTQDTKSLYFYSVQATRDCLGVATLSGGKFVALTGEAKFWVDNDKQLAKKILNKDITDEEVYNDLAGWSNGEIFTTVTPR
jgi:hypothetical protein